MKMKSLLTIIWLFGSLSAMAQLDTIPVSRDYKTILVLPAPYDFSINGKELNFIESFPAKIGSGTVRNIALLIYNDVAPDITDFTNYTIYTRDGLAYDFILKLVDIPSKKRWTITTAMADNLDELSKKRGNHEIDKSNVSRQLDMEQTEVPTETFQEKLSVKTGETEGEPLPLTRELYVLDRMEYIRRRCYYNQFNKGKIIRYLSKFDNVFLWLENVYYENDEIYLQFRLENKEHIDYDVNFIKFSIATKYKNSSSNIKKAQKPLFRYKVPKKVEGNSENYFMVVFDKFTLDRQKVLTVELDEEKGNRNLSLDIDHSVINNPLGFKS
ncbi:hypothetical protein MTsPCn9_21490 [Croceitalea sp. MTPC9]|jgi:hypothetical protein|nr:hypothetical protein MTsPCn6_24770 [Croceitalea sp. MTPC6]GMN17213.1 hypothetical protein MTsPCn9_21490 [Croceitalea sp. MTPC9]